MPGHGRDTAGGPFVVTLVVDLPITKPDALETIAFACDGTVEHARTAYPRVSLSPGAWAEVQIPKFADPLRSRSTSAPTSRRRSPARRLIA